MIKLVSFVAAIGISALAVYLVLRRGGKNAKLTDKRARAEALKQLLALSDEGVPPSTEKKPEKREEKNALKPVPAAPSSVPVMTRQQRRAEQRRKDKIALAKSQHA